MEFKLRENAFEMGGGGAKEIMETNEAMLFRMYSNEERFQ
jgi:hypothetical protein